MFYYVSIALGVIMVINWVRAFIRIRKWYPSYKAFDATYSPMVEAKFRAKKFWDFHPQATALRSANSQCDAEYTVISRQRAKIMNEFILINIVILILLQIIQRL